MEEDRKIRIMKAVDLLDAQQYQRAEPLLRNLVGNLPTAAGLRSRWALALYHVGEKERALSEARAAVETRPQLAYAQYIVSYILRQENELDEALFYAKRAVELSPGRAAYTTNLARVYAARGRETTALKLVEEALLMDPDHTNSVTLRVSLVQRRFLASRDPIGKLIRRMVPKRSLSLLTAANTLLLFLVCLWLFRNVLISRQLVARISLVPVGVVTVAAFILCIQRPVRMLAYFSRSAARCFESSQILGARVACSCYFALIGLASLAIWMH